MSKKILFLADINSSHTRKWAEGVASLGYNVAIFSLSIPDSDWFSIKGIQLLSSVGQQTSYSTSDVQKISYLKQLSALKAVIRSFAPDILHAHYATSYGLLGALTGKHPYIISAWGSDVFDFPTRSFVHKFLMKWIFRRADLILATSKILQKEVELYTDKRTLQTPFGIDTNVFLPLHLKTNHAFTIGIIKKLEPHYGIDYLIKAFQKVLVNFPDRAIRLIIVGDGYMLDEYKKLSVKLEVSEYIKFIGKIPQEEVPAMHNSFDLFVCPSLEESFGVSVLEASSCGIPVVVSDAGGLPEVVANGETGLIVSKANVEALAAAISYFIINPDQVEEFGKRGRKFVCDNYEWKNNLVQINDIYRRL